MSKASVLTFVTDFSTDQVDPVAIDRYYDDIVRDLGMQDFLVQTSLVAVNTTTAIYTPPATTVDLLLVFYDDRVLYKETLLNAEAIGAGWRDIIGTPVAYLVEDQTSKDFRLFPKPEINSKPFIFLFGEPLGRDYSEYAAAVIYTETRVDLPEWLETPVAFEILAREFARESDHKDKPFSDACRAAARLFFDYVGST